MCRSRSTNPLETPLTPEEVAEDYVMSVFGTESMWRAMWYLISGSTELYVKNVFDFVANDGLEGKVRWRRYFKRHGIALDPGEVVRTYAVAIEGGEDGGHFFAWRPGDHVNQPYDAYRFNHQTNGSHKFCQTFAMIYMLGASFYQTRLVPGDYAHNDRVAIEFQRLCADMLAYHRRYVTPEGVTIERLIAPIDIGRLQRATELLVRME